MLRLFTGRFLWVRLTALCITSHKASPDELEVVKNQTSKQATSSPTHQLHYRALAKCQVPLKHLRGRVGISGQGCPSLWGKQRLTLPLTEALFQKAVQIH